MFREDLHPRDRGRFAKKPGSSAGETRQQPARQPDSHSQSVPPQIRESERKRLLQMMGDNPTPQKERHVLRGEADRLTTKARSLMDGLKGRRDQEEAASRQRGGQRRQGAQEKRQREDAERARKGLPAKDRQAERERQKSRTRKPSKAPSKPDASQGQHEQGPKKQLREVYFRLVVVRDMARARGVRL